MKLISTKAEHKLAALIDFSGKYVETLIQSAKKRFDGDTVAELLRSHDEKERTYARNNFGISLPKYRRLQTKAVAILRSFSAGYSMGESKTLIIRRNTQCDLTFYTDISSCVEYAKSSKYRAMHGSFGVVLTVDQLDALERIEGVWTIRHKNNRAIYLQSSGRKQGFCVRPVHGYLVGTSHGKSIEECERLEVKKLEQRLATEKNDAKFLGFKHAKLLGACEAGISAFCQRHNLNADFGYRLGFLKTLKDNVAEKYLARA